MGEGTVLEEISRTSIRVLQVAQPCRRSKGANRSARFLIQTEVASVHTLIGLLISLQSVSIHLQKMRLSLYGYGLEGYV
jgi:ACT domain-containing protein